MENYDFNCTKNNIRGGKKIQKCKFILLSLPVLHAIL